MVRAILDGRKTQTRRAAKPQPAAGVRTSPFVGSGLEDGHGKELRCPYGQPGDRLWVREAWARAYVAQAGQEWFVYRESDNRTDYGGPWKPSIHMPRAACRLVLEITDVRVERLQSISEADARAEGVESEFAGADFAAAHGSLCGSQHRYGFASLWESINGAGSWTTNPWVWAVTFKVVTP